MTNHYMTLRYILLCLCLLAGINASAYDAEIDGIYYNFSGTNATVTYLLYSSNEEAYSGDVIIPETVEYNDKAYNVTAIGGRAFYYCSDLTSVTIPNSVTSIGEYAFYGCSRLASIAFPNSVTSIGSYAFSGTTWLNNQPDGVVYAGKVAYSYKGSMPEGTQITLEEGTLGVADNAFIYSGMASITIPNSVTSIGNRAFSSCSKLTSVIVEEGNPKYDSRDNCNAIIETATNTLTVGCKNTVIPNGVTNIGGSAFHGCNEMSSITIPNGVANINDYAFESCSALTSLTIPESLAHIGFGAFRSCSSLTSITVKDGNGIFDSRDDCNAIIETATNSLVLGCKNTIIPNSVTSIAGDGFFGCSDLTSISIPNSVTTIGSQTFQYSGLTSINIPEGVTTIKNDAFQSCGRLSSVTIPSTIEKINGYAFAWCYRLTNFYCCAKEVPQIYSSTFWQSPIESATLYVPIGSKAAYEAADYWKEFKEIIETDLLVPENVEISGIYYCIDKERKVAEVIPSPDDNLYSGNITIPSSVTYDGETYSVTGVGYKAFRGCTELTSITIPNSVTYISEAAFLGCSDLTSVNIPNSVNSIDEGAFCGCENLTSIIIPEGVTYIGPYAFLGCSGLTRITIPGSVSVIEDITFSGCSGLTSITISEGVTTILPYAFGSCSSLTSITLPSSLTIIDEVAFGQCSSLKDVYCYAEIVPETSPFAFDGSPIETATLHVPASALEAYKTTEPWSGFGVFDPIVLKCATPTIGYANGKLTFKCETEDVAFIYNIKDDDIKYGAGNEVDLCVAYQISVYATKGGIANSNVATATLCWVDQQPEAEGLTDEDAVLEMKALPVLIQTQGSTITIQGAANGTQIYVYATDGMQQATAIAVGGGATLNTSLQPGSVAIVKIGERTIKVLMK